MPKTLIENVVYALAGPGVRQYRLLPDGSLRVVDRDLRKLAFDADEVQQLLQAGQKRPRKVSNDGTPG
jgi:hypothetical protein